MLFRIRYRLFGKQKVSPYLIHVVLDDATIQQCDLPLWDRTIYGRIIRLLSKAEAAAIACDIFFQFESTPENDEVLIAATAESGRVYYPVVLQPKGYPIASNEADIVTKTAAGIVWHPASLVNGTLLGCSSPDMPFAALSERAKGFGHINCLPDYDGINRRFPLLLAYGDGIVPSLTLKAIADYLDVTPEDMEVVAGSHIRLKRARFQGRRERDVTIPIDDRGRILLNNVGPWEDSFIPFPVDRILGAEKDEEIATHLYDVMRDSFVILSNVSTGNKDYGASAFDTVYPLSGIHLNVANMILTENFVTEASLLENVVIGLLIALLLWSVSFGRRSRWFLLLGLLILALFILFHLTLFLLLGRLGIFVPVSLGIIFSLIAISAYHYTTEEKEKSFFRGRYENEKEHILYKNRLILSLAGTLSAPLERISVHARTLSEKGVVQQLPSFREALQGIEQSCTALSNILEELLDLTKYRSVKKPVVGDGQTERGNEGEAFYSEHKKVCILVVDDNENERKRIRDVCEDTYAIVEAENGRTAIEVMQSGKVDLIITDLMMPEMNGDELIAALKKKEETEAIPVILLTGLPEEEMKEEPDDILSKQYTDRELLKSIENTLERAIKKRQLESYKKQLVLTGWPHDVILTENDLLYPEKPIVIVEESKEILQSYRDALQSKGINNIRLFSQAAQVLPFLLKQPVSILVMDTSIHGHSGEELLLDIRRRFPDIPVVMVSGVKEMEVAVRCIGAGAYDYLVKPVEIEKLASLINHCIELRVYRETLESMGSKLKHPGLVNTRAFSHIITQNQKLQSLFHYCEAVSGSPKPFLIMGESGVGKELFAEAIHLSSGRKGKFVCENIGGLDDTLISDALFGHTRGAFTGAVTQRKGFLEEACGGTLFLDEIGDMPVKTQVKLLRLIERNEYRPLGLDSIKRADVRIIGATNKNISVMAKENTFRQDLLERFVHTITIPPLRERWDDLPLLVNHFLNKYGAHKNLFVPDELYGYLKIYDFPGNVRELETMVVNALRLNKGNTLSLSTFKAYINEKRERKGIPEEEKIIEQESKIIVKGKFPGLKEVEEIFINKALEKADGMQSVASQLLGITPSNLSKKLKKMKKKGK